MDERGRVLEMSISDDALANVAVHLALKSAYLEKKRNLVESFWYFFDLLKMSAEDKAQEQERLASLKARIDEDHARALANWVTIGPEIEPILLEGRKAGLKRYCYYTLHEAYRFHGLNKPPAELPDEELVHIQGLGPKSIANIRQVWPAPN